MSDTQNEIEPIEQKCETCRSDDVIDACKLCQNVLCDDCILAPPLHTFSLLETIPEPLSHVVYCRFCYDEQVEPEVVRYAETLEKANESFIFFKTQRKEIPLIRKSKEIMTVVDCDDRDETILRLAFRSAAQGFNAVVGVEVQHQKIRNHQHHTHRWSGSGSPAMIDEHKLDRQYKADQIYR